MPFRRHMLCSPCLKIPFYCIIGSAVMFSFWWSSACSWWWPNLLLMNIFFPLLSSLLPKKLQLNSFFVDVSTSVLILLIFNFCSCPFPRNLICFQFHSSILIYHILFFFNLIFIILIFNFFSWPFCKVFIGF